MKIRDDLKNVVQYPLDILSCDHIMGSAIASSPLNLNSILAPRELEENLMKAKN